MFFTLDFSSISRIFLMKILHYVYKIFTNESNNFFLLSQIFSTVNLYIPIFKVFSSEFKRFYTFEIFDYMLCRYCMCLLGFFPIYLHVNKKFVHFDFSLSSYSCFPVFATSGNCFCDALKGIYPSGKM